MYTSSKAHGGRDRESIVLVRSKRIREKMGGVNISVYVLKFVLKFVFMQ